MGNKNKFDGFGLGSNFTMVPHAFIREKMRNLHGNAVKVMLYIFDRTYGFPDDKGRPKPFDAISYDQFQNGIVTRDGKQLDQGTGLDNKSVRRAIKELQDAGLIFVYPRQLKSNSEWLPTVYEPNVDGKARYKYPDKERKPLDESEPKQPEKGRGKTPIGSGNNDQRVGAKRTEGVSTVTNTKESAKIKDTKESLQEKVGTASIAYAIDGASAPPTPIKYFFKLDYQDIPMLLSATYKVLTLEEAAKAVRWAQVSGITPEELKGAGERARNRPLDERTGAFEELINELHQAKLAG
jgi:hypothetical protein